MISAVYAAIRMMSANMSNAICGVTVPSVFMGRSAPRDKEMRETVDERLAAILALQRRLDRWRRGWHRQHKEQLLRAMAPEPCRDCPMAGIIDMHGVLIYGCDMSHCIAEEVKEWNL